MRRRYALPVLLLLTSARASLPAQTISVGEIRIASFSPLASPEISTVIDLAFGATGDGQLDSATFIWSQAPCPSRSQDQVLPPRRAHVEVSGGAGAVRCGRGFGCLQDRSPVVLGPAVSVRRGDLIAIASLTSCGRPTVHEGGSYFVASGDVRQDVTLPAPVPGIFSEVDVIASGGSPASGASLFLLNGRFSITLPATNPRNGADTAGVPIPGNDRFGSFSLPGFTGDPAFPEIIVKMADATGLPPPFGGGFWFFYSSLTDVRFSLTVTDTHKQLSRVYASGDGAAGPFCGGADTTTFH